MQWDATANAGFTTGKPWLPVYDDYKIYNAAVESEDKGSILNWYRALAKLRNEHPELINGDYRELFPEDDQIFAYSRESDAGKAVIIINLSTEQATYDASCVKDAELVLGTNGGTKRGTLEPLEAVILCSCKQKTII